MGAANFFFFFFFLKKNAAPFPRTPNPRPPADGFREQAAGTRPGRPQNRDWTGVLLDEDFRACSHAGQQGGRVACCFLFRDMNYGFGQAAIIPDVGSSL